ncbi:MAG: hypothetical protein HWE30_06500 [Methylocystaceae bacterium]|nr:hypothetical protein [Methylocystaceae bacterium]
MIKTAHPIAGAVALLTILTFWSATVFSKYLGDPEMIVQVKTMILYGMILLVPAMAVLGGTGFKLGGKSTYPLIVSKRKKMPIIALNGLIILVPSAVILQQMAVSGKFGTLYLIIQSIELIAGALNIILLGIAFRQGLKFTKRI